MVSASARRLTRPLFCNCTALGCGLNNNDLKNICATFGGCQKTVSFEDDQLTVRYSCIPEEQYSPLERPLPCYVHRDNQHTNNVGCCRNYSFCSQDLNVQLASRQRPTSGLGDIQENNSYLSGWHVAFFATFCVAISIALGVTYIVIRKWLYCRPKMRKPVAEIRSFLPSHCGGNGSANYATGDVNNMLLDIERMFDDSGTGGGPALLVPRTIARCIERKELIGKGRFGEVWRGQWKSEDVAVKLFSSRDEKSWLREVDVYETNLTHHENILRYIAADNRDSGISMQLYLITEYHPRGSLFDYLNKSTVNESGMCTMVQSIAGGLAFLHSEITGTKHKPAIAHRDLKSKNILVKNDGTCCIGDLGLAVRYDARSGTIDVPNNGKVGTKRYLAPEVLDSSMNLNQFDNYRRADMYSFGLVIWELCRRTTINGSSYSYQLPYYDMVSPDPSLEEMRKCICDEMKRPSLLISWSESPILREMARIMCECWAARPDARLTALRVRKSTDALHASLITGPGLNLI